MDNTIPEGYCQCGCGTYIGYWQYNSFTQGFTKGQPKSFVSGHHRRLSRSAVAKAAEAHRKQWEKATDIPYGYCWCGCGQKTTLAPQTTKERAWVKGQPVRYRQSHHKIQTGPDYEIDPATNCWLWVHGTTTGGYGSKGVNGGQEYAHRFYYQEKYGPLEEDMQLHHTCYTRKCVNPEHLTPLTCSEHTRLHYPENH